MATHAWKRVQRRWVVAPPAEGAEDLARKLGTATLAAQMLLNRGIDDVETARRFMNPKLSDLHDPQLLPGVGAAADRIARAVAEKERIVIYGDYDVDGITAVAILHTCLHMLDADVHYYVPHRIEEGYGVNTQAVRKIVADGAKLMITVDCGITAHEPLAEAASAGLDVIVTDHHTPDERLPKAVAIVHPRLAGGQYPNGDLCGAGVAFKLAWAVARSVCGNTRVDPAMRDFLVDATSLAALGTIADVVPLTGENRCLVVHGLRGLPASTHPGLRALLESASLTNEKLDAYHVGFVLAPRINACGRMGHARLAVELLTGAPPERCREIARYLAQQNTKRQKIEREIAEQAAEMVVEAGMDAPDRRAIVLASDQWHGGVIGIVASRLVRRFCRPVILIAIDSEGGGQGSGRSIRGFNMRDALAACAEHLVGFGGHAMAGGLRIEKPRIEDFTAALLDYAASHVSQEQLTPSVRIDAETTPAALSYNVVEHLTRLAPFGEGNPPPVVALRSVKLVVPPRRMGRNGQTVGMVLGRDDTTIRAVGFGMGDLADELVGVNYVDVAAEPVLNHFNGRTTAELKLRDVIWE